MSPRPQGYGREGTPFRAHERRVIAVLARPDERREVVEREREVGLVGEPGALEDDLGGQLGTRLPAPGAAAPPVTAPTTTRDGLGAQVRVAAA